MTQQRARSSGVKARNQNFYDAFTLHVASWELVELGVVNSNLNGSYAHEITSCAKDVKRRMRNVTIFYENAFWVFRALCLKYNCEYIT